MKIFLSFLIFLTFDSVVGQEVKYVPIFLDACDSVTKVDSKSMYVTELDVDTLINDHFFYYVGANSIEGLYWFNKDTVILPDTGKYKYRVYGMRNALDLNVEIPIKIDNYGITRDTFFIPRFRLKYSDENSQYRYFECNDIANGNHSGYFYDGRIRISGNFNDGMPIDTLKHYHYSTGNISKMGYKGDKGYNEYRYSKDGSPYSERIYSRGLLKLRGVEKYYVMDTLKEKRRWVKWHLIPQKTLKYNKGKDIIMKEIWSKKLEFYFNNKPVKKLSRRRRYFQGRYSHEKGTLKEVDYRYKLELYDKQGKRVMKVKYDKSDYKNYEMEDHDFYSYHGFSKLKSYTNKKKDYRIKSHYVREESKFLKVKYTRHGLTWKKDTYMSEEELNKIVENTINLTNYNLIPKEK